MAAEYGALLKWPKNLETELKEYMGKPATLVLELQVKHGAEPTQTHTIQLPENWGYNECYELCFEHINPIKTKMTKGSILSLILN